MTGINTAEDISGRVEREFRVIDGGSVDRLVLNRVETRDKNVINFLNKIVVGEEVHLKHYGDADYRFKVEEKGLTTGGWPYFVPSTDEGRGYARIGMGNVGRVETIIFRPNDLPTIYNE